MTPLSAIARFLLLFGVILLVLGGLLLLLGRVPGLGRLPGDLTLEGKQFRFYFPLTSCLLLSGLLTLVWHLFRLFLGK
ncbi:MAG: DUF2905 family protein [Acidobacteria bacterium]|nr:DUF2905 family protein [Acidobacteriota bacterium]